MIKARESRQVIKARKKLVKQLEAENRLINDKAINQMKKAIAIRITRHTEDRIKVKKRPITFFDENRHSAKKSKFVSRMMNKLCTESEKGTPSKPLTGRIKK